MAQISPIALVRLGLLVAAVAAGCAAPPATSPAPPPGPDAEVMAALNHRADAAAAQEHWDHPYENSALDYYRRVLALAPDNLHALRGIETLAERYLQRARSAADRQSHGAARSMLARARLVDSEHPGIAPTESYLALLLDSERQALRMNQAALAARDPGLAQSLQQLGARARHPDCRTFITVRNDQDYRWIYGRMAAAKGQGRIRAQFEVGAPSRVTLLCRQ
ncbi:MAG: hypothetical protein ACR2PZ_26995 [Pseudomonadales bacterium]